MTDSGIMRIQKAISRAGLMSRRSAEQLVTQGRITIDGRIAVLGDRVDPASARIEVDGVPIPVAPGLVAYLLYKPTGVISTADDPHGRPTVLDLVPSDPRVWPVGRLDGDSEGLLILTNDGELTNRLTHPGYGVGKTYVVLVRGTPPARLVRRLVDGVDLDDGPARARSARIVERSRGRTLIEMVLEEGRNREIRRMCDVLDLPVERLVRTGIGPLVDRGLTPGTWRRLTPEEIAGLYRASVEGR